MSIHAIVCSGSSELVEGASSAFNQDGSRLTICESGLEVLGAVGVVNADLLILDLETPGLNGLLIIAAIRELAPALPIMAVSTRPQWDARAVSHKGVSYAALPDGSSGAIQAALTGLIQDRKNRLLSSAR